MSHNRELNGDQRKYMSKQILGVGKDVFSRGCGGLSESLKPLEGVVNEDPVFISLAAVTGGSG